MPTPHTTDRSDQGRHAGCDGDPHRRVHLGCVQRAEETQHYIHVGGWIMSSSHQVMSMLCSMTDDQGYADVGFTNPESPFVTTNIDRIANNSVR